MRVLGVDIREYMVEYESQDTFLLIISYFFRSCTIT